MPDDTGTGERSGELGALPGASPMLPIAEVSCDDDADAAIRLAINAQRWSLPLVLRGCALSMPAVSRWANDSYVRERLRADEDAFAHTASAHTTFLDDLDPAVLADTWWPGAFGEHLWAFARQRDAKALWVSAGDTGTAAHFDTFDNLHTVVAGHKEIRLVPPSDAAKMYIDWAPASRPAGSLRTWSCPGSFIASAGSFGCDVLGCFGFVPWDPARVDLARYPRVADARVHRATLRAGDALLIPAFHFHYVLHRPLAGRGRCVALTFTRQPQQADLGDDGPSLQTMRPFASDLVRFWAARVRARARDPAWSRWHGGG